ncbi:hypothetical protein FJ950_18025 [Mesorhizobium sp. B2-3-14]|uniref:hypothetical protein n=1 Tax=Mesorhizobium sp. B2-3-14 TaxID=2589950 RepID=UPI001129C7D0|nr:hypothetical protein [Mesorhizobium sp. B2-3-14]TPL84089.1 hypothetical protein FJ950_18025 [Mesorhizobium sp. B2-3-14]
MAGDGYSPIIKGIFIAEAIVGSIALIAFLWTGKGIALIYGRGVFLIDRSESPYLYWSGLAVILAGFVAFPIWSLYRKPRRR